MKWTASESLSELDTERMLQETLIKSVHQYADLSTGHDLDVVREAARSVAVHCASRIRFGIETGQLHLLFSRALWSVGETAVAEQMLELGVESRQIRATLLALLQAGAVAPDLWPLVGNGTIRYHESWLAADSQPVWCLDTPRITGWGDETELAQSLALKRIICSLAQVWDQTNGAGCLATRGEVGQDRPGWQIRMVRAWLEQCAHLRGWRSIPRVLRMELSAHTH